MLGAKINNALDRASGGELDRASDGVSGEAPDGVLEDEPIPGKYVGRKGTFVRRPGGS